jgi:hypothetical protein
MSNNIHIYIGTESNNKLALCNFGTTRFLMNKMCPSTSCVKTQDKGFEGPGECASLSVYYFV